MRLQACLAILICLSLVGINSTSAQTLDAITRLSVSATGQGGDADSGTATISPSGKFLAFDSQASNLVSNDTNGTADIFTRSLISGEVQRVNLGPNGAQADGVSRQARITAVNPNGYFAVVFESDATNIAYSSSVPDTNGLRDIYFSLPTRSYTERVSLGLGGVVANGASSDPSATTIAEPNQLLVAYASAATNLVAIDQNNFADIFLTTISTPDGTDLDTPSTLTTVRVSESSSGVQANGPSRAAVISGDGKWIVFESDASNLIAGLDVRGKQIYLYEVATHALTLVSASASLVGGDGDSTAPYLSYDGSYVVYSSRASDIVKDGKSGSSYQVFRYSRLSGTTDRINVSASGEAGNGAVAAGLSTSISPNGRYITFSDSASNLLAGDTNGKIDVFLKDTLTGTLSLLSRGFDGTQTDADSTTPILAGQSYNSKTTFCIFSSSASNLVSGDTSGRNDVFLAPLTVVPSTFTKGTSLEVPPDVAIFGQSIVVTLEQFKGVNLKSAAMLTWAEEFLRKRFRLSIRYQIEATNVTPNVISDVRKRQSKRNQFALGNLKPGSIYSVRSKVLVVRGKRVKFQSGFSPAQRIATPS